MLMIPIVSTEETRQYYNTMADMTDIGIAKSSITHYTHFPRAA